MNSGLDRGKDEIEVGMAVVHEPTFETIFDSLLVGLFEDFDKFVGELTVAQQLNDAVLFRFGVSGDGQAYIASTVLDGNLSERRSVVSLVQALDAVKKFFFAGHGRGCVVRFKFQSSPPMERRQVTRDAARACLYAPRFTMR